MQIDRGGRGAERRPADRERKSINSFSKRSPLGRWKVKACVHKVPTYKNNDGYGPDERPDEMVIKPQPAATGHKR